VKPPRWIVPLVLGEVDDTGPHIAIDVLESDDGGLVIDIVFPLGAQPLLSPIVACQLGQALQDAAAWCGQERARREERKR